MVFAFETYQFLNPEAVAHIERVVPRSRRVVIDQDGMYSDTIRVGSDTNHPTPQSHESWSSLFERLTDTVLQPCLEATTPGVQPFLYFGFDAPDRSGIHSEPTKLYDITYVGNNWYRWHDVVQFLEAIAPTRSQFGRIALFGKWWHGAGLAGSEEHTYSDPDFLRTHEVDVFPAVAFDQVVPTMSLGRVNPVFIRPVLNALNLVTPRMFESFVAQTVPLLPADFRGAKSLYGANAELLQLHSGFSTAERVLEILTQYAKYRDISREISAELARLHSYEVRLEQLLGFAR